MQMVEEALAYFALLETNTSKGWFNPRKDNYRDAIAGPVGFVFVSGLLRHTGAVSGGERATCPVGLTRGSEFKRSVVNSGSESPKVIPPASAARRRAVWLTGLSSP